MERVLKLLSTVGIEPMIIDAGEQFLSALEGVADPEEKRRVVGRLYAEVLELVARELGAEYLVQGTIYPDVIESGASPGADVIKTHHTSGVFPGIWG